MLIFIWEGVIGQTMSPAKSKPLKSTISVLSADFQHYLYVGTSTGEVLKLDTALNEMQSFNLPDFAAVSHVESWNPLKLFVFSRHQQEFLFTERFVAVPEKYPIRDFVDEYVEQASVGQDNSIWFVNSLLSLRKFDLTRKIQMFEVPLRRNLGIEKVHTMKSYRNGVILSNPDFGIYLIDQYGSLINQMELSGIEDFTIHNNQLNTIIGNQIFMIDLVTLKKETIMAPFPYKTVITVGKRYFFIDRNKILAYDLR